VKTPKQGELLNWTSFGIKYISFRRIYYFIKMEPIYQILLFIHVVAGFTGLLSGLLNMIMKKGGKTHRIVGKFFVAGMMISSFIALIMASIKINYFLFVVGIFTIYLVGTGNRYIYLKLLGKSQKPKILDWILTCGMFLMGIVFIILGVILLKNQQNSFGVVPIVFAFVGFGSVREDILNYTGRIKSQKFWLKAHVSRMSGGFIAASTAFLAVNAQKIPLEIPTFVYWLLPTIVITPLISKWQRKLRAKK
jgi:uncharacterized membrane protein